MTRIYIDGDKTAPVSEIAWTNKDNLVECIRIDPLVIFIKGSDGVQFELYREDIDKLIAALQKAKELGWDKS